VDGSTDLLFDLAIVLCTAAVTTVVFQKLRAPVVLGYILAGLIVGPHFHFPLYADPESVRLLSELGVIVLLFSIGLEFSVRKLLRMGARSGIVTALACGLTLWLGFSVSRLMGWSVVGSAFAAGMIAVSSTMFVAASLAERQMERDERDLIFGITVFEDMVGILLIAGLTALATGADPDLDSLGRPLMELVGFLVVTSLVGLLTIPRLIRAVVRLGSRETMLVASMGIAFALSLLARSLELSVALGAFLAGVLVAESGEARRIEVLVRPVRDVFAAVFFVAIGMLLDPAALLEIWPLALALVGALFVAKVGGVVGGGFMIGLPARSAVRAGAIVSQTGEYSFLIASVGLGIAEGPLLHALAVSVCVMSIAGARLLVSRSDALGLALDRRMPEALRTFLSLWGNWLEDLRAKRADPSRPRSKLPRSAVWLVVDAAAIVGLVIGVSLTLPLLAERLRQRIDAPLGATRTIVIALTVAAALPFLIGLLRHSRKLAAFLADEVLPARSARADLAAAPRRTFELGLQITVLLCLGLPAIAVAQPFLPSLPGAVVVLLAAIVALALLWRRITDLHGHVRAGAEVVVELLANQSRAAQDHDLTQIAQILPGIGDVTAVEITPGSRGLGRTLGDLDLHGHTGATVVALQRGEKGIVSPGAGEVLRAGDVLAITGSDEAIHNARERVEGRSDSRGGPG
jgi:CPA2 family monovalent cation:H+ antiporter-2